MKEIYRRTMTMKEIDETFGNRGGEDFARQQPTKITIKSKLEGETEEQYVERLVADYTERFIADHTERTETTTPPALLDRVVSFIRVMASKVFEPVVSQEIQDARLATCYGCDAFQINFDAPELIGHCGACGCSKNQLSSLATKSKIQVSSCPRKLWDITIQPEQVDAPSTLDEANPTTPVQTDAETP